ncbi:MAG TPA: hypothetical protein EYO19_04385 [Candidatus Marinimicrobia bacterium]|nr:hypothetical protein [Candidatus Neomarinimicrobiota bacterium]
MNIRFRFAVILFILLSAIFGRTGDLIFHSIESQLSKYRYSINKRDISVINGIIRLEITARRTNIKSQQLLGFLSVGRAMQSSSNPFREVHIIIHYEIRGVQEILITAPVELVIQLSQGKLSPKQFFDKIGN